MSDKFKGAYKVDDGYAGKSRPQYFMIHADDLNDDITDQQLEEVYAEEAAVHFREHISFSVDRLDDFLAWAHEQLSMRKQEDEP